MEKPVISYKCSCDISTLKLLMATEKDYIKSHNNIVDMQNDLYEQASKRNALVAKLLLGDNPEIVIQAKDFYAWVRENDVTKSHEKIDYIRISLNSINELIFEFITETRTYGLDDMDYDVQVDINNILECSVKTLFHKLTENKK